MLGIEDYSSSSDAENDTITPATQKPSPLTSKLPPPSKSSASSSTSKVSLPPPKSKRGPVKIAIGFPTLTKNGDAEDIEDDLKDEKPAMKKPRLESGAGSSSLLSMLPAPKQKKPLLPPPERTLGGGKGRGLVFRTHQPAATPDSTAQDLDGHDNEVPSEKPTPPPPAFTLPTISSAPVVPTFTPPAPTQEDPYPGYYLLPSGSWAAHDPTYYAGFLKKWESEYNAHVRALEKGMVKGFEGMEDAGVAEVDAMKEMEKAKVEIQEREERKAVTKGADGAPAAPKMNINASKQSGRARSRHQLSTLLSEAYENREMLEERIAEGRRNRKEAGNKYGF